MRAHFHVKNKDSNEPIVETQERPAREYFIAADEVGLAARRGLSVSEWHDPLCINLHEM